MSEQPNAATTGAGDGAAAAPPADFDSFAAAELDIQPTNYEADAAAAATAPNADETKPPADAAATTDDAAAKAAADAAAVVVNPWAVDDKALQAALAHPELGGLVKTLHGQLQEAAKWREHFPTLEEAQQAKALAPGGIEELKGYVDRAKEAQAEQAEFASGVPERQKAALESIANEMPEQFAASLPTYLGLVAAKNPEAYQKHMQGELRRALEADGTPAIVKTLLEAADGDPDNPKQAEAFANAFTAVRQWADRMGFTAKAAATAAETKKVDPELAKAQERIKTYEEAEQKQKVEAFTSWWQPTQTEIATAVKTETKARLEKMLPQNIEKSFKEFTMNQLTEQIEKRLTQQLLADAGLQQKLFEVMGKPEDGKWQKDAAGVRQQYVNLNTARAMQLLPHIVAEVMKPHTEARVASAGAKNAAESTAGKRADVTGGAGENAAKVPFSVKDVRRRGALAGKSDEDILEM
jgi:hypothetical protein